MPVLSQTWFLLGIALIAIGLAGMFVPHFNRMFSTLSFGIGLGLIMLTTKGV